ncbi:MAG TPA: hypothetical protein VG939_16495 [Caulobacteraceae bacterium]|nr:hypothetical protein [Caulobacteraceae bacterium]
MWRWQRRLNLWINLALALAGAAAVLAGLAVASARWWYVSLPVLIAAGGGIWWGLGPARDAAPGGEPMPPLLRLGLTLVLLAAAVVGLALAAVIVGWLADLWYVAVPVAIAFAVLIWLALKPEKPKSAPKPPDIVR